jgi:hypothetical protein
MITNISELNRGWGICGFASSLAALYQNGHNAKIIDRAVGANQLETRLLAEIKTFLVTLQAENNTTLLKEIETINRSLVSGSFSIPQYIKKINTIATTLPNRSDSSYSLAMTPNALINYLKFSCGFKNVKVIPRPSTEFSAFDNVILGLSSPKVKDTRWNRLAHWVYKKNNYEIYNWGQKVTLEELLATDDFYFKIIYEIRNLS